MPMDSESILQNVSKRETVVSSDVIIGTVENENESSGTKRVFSDRDGEDKSKSEYCC